MMLIWVTVALCGIFFATLPAAFIYMSLHKEEFEPRSTYDYPSVKLPLPLSSWEHDYQVALRELNEYYPEVK